MKLTKEKGDTDAEIKDHSPKKSTEKNRKETPKDKKVVIKQVQSKTKSSAPKSQKTSNSKSKAKGKNVQQGIGKKKEAEEERWRKAEEENSCEESQSYHSEEEESKAKNKSKRKAINPKVSQKTLFSLSSICVFFAHNFLSQNMK